MKLSLSHKTVGPLLGSPALLHLSSPLQLLALASDWQAGPDEATTPQRWSSSDLRSPSWTESDAFHPPGVAWDPSPQPRAEWSWPAP